MAFPVTLNGRTYTLADFEGTNYVDGLPDAFEDFVTQAGDIYNSTSTSSVAIGTGSKTFTTADSGKPYQAGTPLRIADAAAPETNFMDAIVTSYSGTTLVVDVFGYAGSGTKSNWTINIGGAKTVDGTLAVAQGGTGATSAADARTNIDVYSKSEADSKFLDVSGEASNVTMTGDVTIGDTSGDTLTVNATASFSGDLAVDTDTLFVDVSAGNVGIGTASPNYPLTVENTSSLGARIQTEATTGSVLRIRGNSGATECLEVTADGNVGIGTASPSALLNVADATGNASILITAANTSDSRLYFGDANSDVVGLLQYDHSNNSMTMSTNSVERMRIDSSGNVGIGTSSPNYPLEISSSSYGIGFSSSFTSTPATITFTNGSNRTSTIRAEDFGSSLVLSADTQSGNSSTKIAFETDGSERMRIDASGNVGIGTDSPSKLLELESSDPTIRLSDATDSTFSEISYNAGALDIDAGATSASKTIRFLRGGTESMRIDSSGNVGIGTASPSVYGKTTLVQTTNASSGGLAIVDSTLAQSAKLWCDTTNAYLSSGNSGSDPLILNAGGGNVGIGTASPGAQLEVASTTNGTIRITGDGANAANNPYGSLEFYNLDSSGGGPQVAAKIEVESSSTGTGAGGQLAFYGGTGAATEQMRIDSSGKLLLNTTNHTATETEMVIASEYDATGGTNAGITLSARAGGTWRNAGIFAEGTAMTFTTNTLGLGGASAADERMRLDSSGNLLVGMPSSGVSTSKFGIQLGADNIIRSSANLGATGIVFQTFGNAGVFRTKGDGDAENTNNSYGGLSDVSLKENIVDASPQLDDIMAMRVRSYNLKSTGAKHIGVIAQELEETSPELVKTDEEGMKSVKYSVMYMKAIKALQEAVTRIETLEAEVAALKGA